MAFVLFHLDDAVVALKEARRVLSPGGVVGTATWADDPETEASRAWEQELDDHGAWDPMPARPRRDEQMNTPEKVSALFSLADLRPERVWVERFVHQWDLDGLSLMHSTFGKTKPSWNPWIRQPVRPFWSVSTNDFSASRPKLSSTVPPSSAVWRVGRLEFEAS